jgi:hypothetical protein
MCDRWHLTRHMRGSDAIEISSGRIGPGAPPPRPSHTAGDRVADRVFAVIADAPRYAPITSA